jgi:hypothetical protein
MCDDFHFPLLRFSTLLDDFQHPLTSFNSPQLSLSLPSFSKWSLFSVPPATVAQGLGHLLVVGFISVNVFWTHLLQ